ncbi:MAG: HAD-IIIA family hydrolase [Terrimonas sp.]|nr:HAD-IIIA family hydrolase [Terrimonas sp.]
MPASPFDQDKFSKKWSLFLDRDGVINYDKEGSYIFNTGEFILYDGVPEAIKKLNTIFGHIFIVTNQRGVGKGLMTLDDLNAIHQKMVAAFNAQGGHIDQIYFADSLDNDHPDRKPNPGMAFLAQKDFPAVDLSKSIMVGNKLSDMRFGRNAGMKTVYIATTHPEVAFPHPDIDYRFDLLIDFAKAL